MKLQPFRLETDLTPTHPEISMSFKCPSYWLIFATFQTEKYADGTAQTESEFSSPVPGRTSPELDAAVGFSWSVRLDPILLPRVCSELGLPNMPTMNRGFKMTGTLSRINVNLRMKDLSSGVVAVMMLTCASARAYMAVGMPE